jgi:hypothetical protein
MGTSGNLIFNGISPLKVKVPLLEIYNMEKASKLTRITPTAY